MKGKEKGKSKQKASGLKPESDSGYEWHDSSIRDDILRARIVEGYEQFKVCCMCASASYSLILNRNLGLQLTHGSFTSILSVLGREALELQLERFFTVWAWSLDMENGDVFGRQLGMLRVTPI